MMNQEFLAAELESFRMRYPFDEDANNYILNSSIEVQQEVLRDFKPKQEGEQDYSALIIGFTKRRRQSVKERQQNRFVPHHVPAHGLNDGGEQDAPLSPAELQAFRSRYPFDEDAYRYIASSLPHVQREIVRTFKPPREGEEDYSALIITFSKRCRNAVSSGASDPIAHASHGPSSLEYEAFRQRYPFDLDTHNYLQSSAPEVRRQVLQSFKPPREGEADYSALLISFCKKMRDQRVQPMQHMQPMHHMQQMQMQMQPMQMHQYANVAFQRPHEAQFVPWKGPQAAAVGHPWQPRGDDRVERALEAFRQRYPMDERAFDFLRAAQPWVRQEVLEKFSPQRQDTDYSALIISFAKKCRERESQMLAAKRPRVF
ncbi:unnamed protein product [Effrenium voratum]|nr:unnamed protein product [Effrenium voratum]